MRQVGLILELLEEPHTGQQEEMEQLIQMARQLVRSSPEPLMVEMVRQFVKPLGKTQVVSRLRWQKY